MYVSDIPQASISPPRVPLSLSLYTTCWSKPWGLRME